MAINSKVGGQIHIRAEIVARGWVRDSLLAEMIGGDAACPNVQRADSGDEARFDRVVPPGPCATTITALTNTVMETPWIDEDATRAYDTARREFAEGDTGPHLQSSSEVAGLGGEPAASRYCTKPCASVRASGRAKACAVCIRWEKSCNTMTLPRISLL